MDRPKRKVATVDYKKFNNFGTFGIDDMAFEYIFQKMADSNSDRDELQLHAEEDDILDLMSDDESNKLNEAAALIYTTPHKTKSKESDELKKHESDEDLELRIKLLEEKKQRLKRDQLNKRIKELEAEVDGMSKLEEKPKKKSKKSKGEITLTNLRANDKLNKDVNDEMKRLEVVQLPESVLRGNSSTESESETSSTSSSEDSSDYELSAKLSSKKRKIAYFSSIYHWASVLEFYAAWLTLIELGRKTWSDDSQMLENVMLSGQSLPKEVRQANFTSVSKNQTGKEQIWFCVKYQRNKCEHSNSTHTTVIRVFEVILPEQNSLLNLHNSFIGVSGYNFDLFKVPVYSELCIKFWRQELCDYEDQEVCDMLEFGWPLGFDRKFEEFGNNKIAKNHSGARDFAKDIDKYIKKEVGYGAVLGPFASNQFNDHLVISPLNSVPKANSEERRVIMDLSFPKGKHVELHYPNVDNFIEIIKKKGEFCKIFKRDLRRAYRQIPVDPKDYNLIGFSWKGHYFVDRVLPMGLKSSAFICQTVTNAVRFIAKNHDISLINYLDEFAGAEISEKADISFKKLKWVLDSCGLEESVEKASSPSHRMSFFREFKNEDCVLEVSLELKHDLLWWSEFLEIYNGVSLLNLQEWTEPDEYMASDACLVGCGGVSNGQFFHCVFPDFIVQQNLHINALELLSVIVCLKLWGQKGRKIYIQCDNMVSVQVINQGKSRSRFLQACLREICFICAIKECELRAIHIDGIDNRLPDMLSRWSLSDIYPIQFYKSIEVQFHWSKTIQFGERVLEIPIIKNLSSPLCAFSAFKAMCIKCPASASSPAFLVLSGRKIKPVSYNIIQTFKKNIIEKIGLDPTRYSSHSFRRGGATWAFQCGVSSELIQLQGDWKSDAYKLYIRYGLADKMQVSSKMICRL
ncbi:unnamed protein product [Mytilus coruscus]|uniref:Reverse transcriptase domain-containing protein n=1 Tax=Mytilus coruscus TaxID=42192 RepID=A0A6J8BW76_MYTCO|nr:unnamed protein product [Mytilus coruscus]